MRTRLAVTAAGAMAVMAAATAPAGAIGMSLNYVTLPQHVTLDMCLNLAESQLANSGLSVLQRTTSAAWAEPMNASEIYSVYCIVDRGIAVLVGSGDDLDAVDNRLSQIFQNLDYSFNGK